MAGLNLAHETVCWSQEMTITAANAHIPWCALGTLHTLAHLILTTLLINCPLIILIAESYRVTEQQKQNSESFRPRGYPQPLNLCAMSTSCGECPRTPSHHCLTFSSLKQPQKALGRRNRHAQDTLSVPWFSYFKAHHSKLHKMPRSNLVDC